MHNGHVTSAFPHATGKQLGYQPDAVDAFLERARRSYEVGEQHAASGMTSAEVRSTAFPLKRKGYAARFVDAAMDRLEEVFFERERRMRIEEVGEEAWWAETKQLLSEVRGRIMRPRKSRFRRRGWFASGYRRSEVDGFLERVSGLLAGTGSLSTAEVRSAVFHSEWRGYDEDQVDALLDAVIQLMLTVR